MHSKIEHFFNEKAGRLIQDSARRIGSPVPKGLSDWITQADFYNGYFLGPRDPRDSLMEQIVEAADRLDDFSVEMTLNKIHLEDELNAESQPDDCILVYFAVCDYFPRYLLERGVTKPLLLWYSTDVHEPDVEFPSHTMSFGFPRSEKDYYYLDVESFRADAVVGTQISINP
ncbi:hypothetical protein [Rhizobium leguminosarum]